MTQVKMCVLEDKPCNGCGECDRCDLNPVKTCDNCGKCIDTGSDSRAIGIDGIYDGSSSVS